VIWVRNLARFLASEGRTIFLSSHLMSEMAQTADHIIVLGRGRIIADAPVGEILALATGTAVLVRTPDAERFGALLAAPDVTVSLTAPQVIQVTGLSAPQIGELAARNGIVLHELSPQAGSLEDAYLALTKDEVEYHAGGTPR
jgi:ABC-2 type transport system ATP-binding protein